MIIVNAIDGYHCNIFRTKFLLFGKKKLVAHIEFSTTDDIGLLTIYDDELGPLTQPVIISHSSKTIKRAYHAVLKNR